ncbi:MAG TPA: DUF5989 family protein [Gemmataceae bacterium]|nr:DUF5989 family protein [Gemmataceae bacterium]
MRDEPKSAFEQAASVGVSENIVSEFWCFLKQNKKWWLLPILVLLLLFGLLLLMSTTAAAPFIYTLF